jgi:hypothetical protein
MNNEESPLKTIISAAKEGLEKTAVLILFVGGLPSCQEDPSDKRGPRLPSR